MNKKKIIIGLAMCTLLSGLPTQAATRNKQVQYYNPNFYYNGVQKDLDASVVIIDGTTYAPVRGLSNALGLNLSWDTRSNTLAVNGSSTSGLSSQQELQAKDYEITSLKKELEQLKENGKTTTTTRTSSKNRNTDEYDQTEGRDILGTELTATGRALDDEYENYFDDIEFDFSVKLSSSKLKVTITYDNSSENREFNKLSNKKIKEFVEDVCETIRNRHDDIAIEGVIKYSDNNSTKYYFDYSRKDKLTSGTRSNYDKDDDDDYYGDDITESDILRILNGRTEITIDDYNGSITVNRIEASVNDNKERIKLDLYLDLTEEMKTALNSNKGSNNDSSLKSYLKDYARRISDKTDYDDIQVYVYNGNSIIAHYYDEDDTFYVYGV